MKTRTRGAWEHLPTSHPMVFSPVTIRGEILDTLRALPEERSRVQGLQAHCSDKLVSSAIPGHDSMNQAGQGTQLLDN